MVMAYHPRSNTCWRQEATCVHGPQQWKAVMVFHVPTEETSARGETGLHLACLAGHIEATDVKMGQMYTVYCILLKCLHMFVYFLSLQFWNLSQIWGALSGTQGLMARRQSLSRDVPCLISEKTSSRFSQLGLGQLCSAGGSAVYARSLPAHRHPGRCSWRLHNNAYSW